MSAIGKYVSNKDDARVVSGAIQKIVQDEIM